MEGILLGKITDSTSFYTDELVKLTGYNDNTKPVMVVFTLNAITTGAAVGAVSQRIMWDNAPQIFKIYDSEGQNEQARLKLDSLTTKIAIVSTSTLDGSNGMYYWSFEIYS